MTYKIRLLSTKYPSYPNVSSFLDVVLVDTRLTFHDIEDDCDLDSMPYE